MILMDTSFSKNYSLMMRIESQLLNDDYEKQRHQNLLQDD